jgi:hypothetical protein
VSSKTQKVKEQEGESRQQVVLVEGEITETKVKMEKEFNAHRVEDEKLRREINEARVSHAQNIKAIDLKYQPQYDKLLARVHELQPTVDQIILTRKQQGASVKKVIV